MAPIPPGAASDDDADPLEPEARRTFNAVLANAEDLVRQTVTGSVAILPPPVAPPPRPFVRPGHARRADGGAFAHVRNDPQRYYAAAAAEASFGAAGRSRSAGAGRQR